MMGPLAPLSRSAPLFFTVMRPPLGTLIIVQGSTVRRPAETVIELDRV